MRAKCDVRLFYISTSDKDRSYLTNALEPSQYQFFTFEDTTNIQAAINSAIQDQQCIRRETSFNPYSDESYFCNRLSALTPTHLRNMTEAQCNICQTTFREGDSTDSVKPCWSCNFGSPKNTTQAQCFKCPNRFWRSSNTTCYSCSAGDVGGTTEAECLRCPNRFWRSNELTTSTTNCFNCDRTSSVGSITQSDCFSCPNRFWRSSNTTCYSCNSGDVSGTTKEECLRCTNRFWRGTLTTSTINCFNCDRSDSVTNTTREECHQCPNRFWGGADLNKNTNRCYICTAGSVSNVRQEDCLRCPNRVWTYKSTDASGIQLGTCAKQ